MERWSKTFILGAFCLLFISLSARAQQQGSGLMDLIYGDGKVNMCFAIHQTSECQESFGYASDIEIVIDKSYETKRLANGSVVVTRPQQMAVYGVLEYIGTKEKLFEGPVSTGLEPEFETPSGRFPLAIHNGGRLYQTRNHCSSVEDYGVNQGRYIELAPMPYAVHFNGGIALHAGKTTGKPESHGCVRQSLELARMTYCFLLDHDNWKRAVVIVR